MTCALLQNNSGMDSEEAYTYHTVMAFEEVVNKMGMKWVWSKLSDDVKYAIIDQVDSWEGIV